MYKYTAIIIEPRIHNAFSFVFKNFYDNLSNEWSFIIFHGTKNKEYIKKNIVSLENGENRIQLINLNTDNLYRNEYNDLLKSKNFYNDIPTEVFLIFQIDTLIIKENRHLINDFLEYDYVGAPWSDEVIGNGGLSLRRKSKMIEIIENTDYNIFFNEDEFFCRQKNVMMNLPNFEKSKQFSIETVFYESPFGVHNFYNHLSRENCDFLMNKYPDLLTLYKLNSKKFTIIYKTYKNDLEWLKYSLLSLKKFLDPSNLLEIIIYSHDVVCGDVGNLLNNIKMGDFINYRIIPIHYNYHGYIKQQTVKVTCHKDVKSEYVILLDSDLILTKYFNLNSLIRDDGKIEWKYLKIEDDPDNIVFSVWKKAYEDSTFSTQNVHYMSNGFPFIFTKKSLEEAENKFVELHNCDYDSYCYNRCNDENIIIENSVREQFHKLSRIFSEFEYLGYFCHNFSNDYIFTITKKCLMVEQNQNNKDKDSYFIQFWSHGGLNDEIIQKINTFLHP